MPRETLVRLLGRAGESRDLKSQKADKNVDKTSIIISQQIDFICLWKINKRIIFFFFLSLLFFYLVDWCISIAYQFLSLLITIALSI